MKRNLLTLLLGGGKGMERTRTASCFCGAVQIETTGEPTVTGYCHCTDCANWASAPLQRFSLWTPAAVKVTAGAEKLGSFTKSGDSHRKFCTQCGGHVMNERSSLGLNSIYLGLVPDLDQQASLHVYYEEKTLSVADGLPKYKDVPSEFGGSGEILPD